jgi:predicted HTH domain antitoxin
MSDNISIKLPKDLEELSGLNRDQIEKKSQLIWVLELYSSGSISLSKASQLSGLMVDDFLKEFYSRHLKHVGGPETVDEANRELNELNKALNREVL